MKLPNINEIAVSVIPTRTPDTVYESSLWRVHGVPSVVRQNLALAMDLASLRGIG